MARVLSRKHYCSHTCLDKKVKTLRLICFSTLPVDDYNFGKEARVYRKGAAGSTDGFKTQDAIFWMSANDPRGGDSWKRRVWVIENWEGFRQPLTTAGLF